MHDGEVKLHIMSQGVDRPIVTIVIISPLLLVLVLDRCDGGPRQNLIGIVRCASFSDPVHLESRIGKDHIGGRALLEKHIGKIDMRLQ